MIFFILETMGAIVVSVLSLAFWAIRSARIVGEEIDEERGNTNNK